MDWGMTSTDDNSCVGDDVDNTSAVRLTDASSVLVDVLVEALTTSITDRATWLTSSVGRAVGDCRSRQNQLKKAFSHAAAFADAAAAAAVAERSDSPLKTWQSERKKTRVELLPKRNAAVWWPHSSRFARAIGASTLSPAFALIYKSPLPSNFIHAKAN
jgi:hypothetical protein